MTDLLSLVLAPAMFLTAIPVIAIAKHATTRRPGRATIAPFAATAVAPRPAPPGRARLRVLVVDDRALVGEQVARMLPAHDVTPVRSAQEAMAQAGQHDAILYALAMPGMSGFAFADQLAMRQPALRPRLVFMLDRAPSAGMIGKVERAGVRWITKPLHYAPLATAVDSVAAARMAS